LSAYSRRFSIARVASWSTKRRASSHSKFLNDPDFAQQAYVFSEPLIAKKAGGDPRSLLMSELGFDPYTSVVVARRTMCDERPELVEKFVRATRRGWENYLKDPTATNEAINGVNPDMDLESLTEAANAIRPLCELGDGNDGPFGSMDFERWQTIAEAMKAIDAISTDATEAASQAWRTIE